MNVKNDYCTELDPSSGCSQGASVFKLNLIHTGWYGKDACSHKQRSLGELHMEGLNQW